MYLARSRAGSFAHFGPAACAACTAASTSFSPASAISLRTSSFDGLMVAKYFFDLGATNLPLMNRLCFGSMATLTVSWAGEYSKIDEASLGAATVRVRRGSWPESALGWMGVFDFIAIAGEYITSCYR